MTFLAGATALNPQRLDNGQQARFQKALAAIEPLLPCAPKMVFEPSTLLAQAGHGRLWQGPKLLSNRELNAAAVGIQWRRVQEENTALEALAREFLGPDPHPPEAFDGFSCALVPRSGGTAVLATDPVGLFPLCYAVEGGVLFFSSHQKFLRLLLGPNARPHLQAAMEFLVAGHPLGDKTLLDGVRLLAPGNRLICGDGGIRISPYAQGEARQGASGESDSASRAAGRLYDFLVHKRDRYSELSKEPVIGFLSGGWDSRFLVALFADAGRIHKTLTTQQRVRLGPCYVSEERIARAVAEFLGVENRFVAPCYRDPSTLHRRAALLDNATWFHDWAFAMADAVPTGRVLLLDGLLGDILIRGLFLDDELAAAQKARDRRAMQGVLHRRYVEGFNTYTPGLEAWESVLQAGALKAFSKRLWEGLEEELKAIDRSETATLFFLRNRSRRAIAPLPRLVFGRKGDVHLPFCDPGFLRLALSLPLEKRRDGSIYRRLLERVRPGLSRIPSTNDKDTARLASFLTETLPPDTLRGRKERKQARLQALCHQPPRVFASIMKPEIRTALASGDPAVLERHLLLLEKIQMVEGFFQGAKDKKAETSR